MGKADKIKDLHYVDKRSCKICAPRCEEHGKVKAMCRLCRVEEAERGDEFDEFRRERKEKHTDDARRRRYRRTTAPPTTKTNEDSEEYDTTIERRTKCLIRLNLANDVTLLGRAR